MGLLERLEQVWSQSNAPFIVHGSQECRFSEVRNQAPIELSEVNQGDVVALIGDFEPRSIFSLLHLVDMGAIVVPLTEATSREHESFFESACVDVVVDGTDVFRRRHDRQNDLIGLLRAKGHGGLVLFSTGTTGRSKAILHDLTVFLKRFETPRPALRTVSFLLFDHIGGLNTLLHTLFNGGVVIVPTDRSIEAVLEACRIHGADVLPTTPTFLRMMLMSGLIPERIPPSLKIITYGTERMDQPTLDELCRLLPDIDFRQTYGMSELGIVRVKSEARNSLYMKVGGEGVETRVVDGILQIRSQSRMLGYLNAPSPFDSEGWYDTKDVVEERDGYCRVVGRTGDLINVGGLKFMASEVEHAALEFPDISLVKAYPRSNPLTGQHVELLVHPPIEGSIDRAALLAHLKSRLQPHMVPKRICFEEIEVGHRFKKN